jgi:NAD(P) transhydrogenase subunit alpha
MYANNMANLMDLLCPKPAKGSEEVRKLDIDMDDKVIRGMTVVKDGEIRWPPPADVTKTAATPAQNGERKTVNEEKETSVEKKSSVFSKRVFDLTTVGELCGLTFGAFFFGIVAAYAHITFVSQLLYFILAGFLGYYLIWSVEPALFSPLMSTSNSLSGVVILGGMLMASLPQGSAANVLGCTAITVAAINVFGGFAVSYRMLSMFKAEKH